MLPKVATTVLHTGSRAAAAVHTQSHTLRNVFQLQSQSPSSSAKGGAGSSGSGRGNGPSSGGPKYNTGSRFQKGYHGASRAVSQVNTSSTQDSSTLQSDDTEELAVLPNTSEVTLRSHRLRSNSLNLLPQPSVLKAVQTHARAHHVFARPHDVPSSSKLAPPPLLQTEALNEPSTSTVPSSSRSLSTESIKDAPSMNPSSIPPIASSSSSSLADSQPESAIDILNVNLRGEQPDQHYLELRQVVGGKTQQVVEAVNKFRRVTAEDGMATTRAFNTALEALYNIRLSGESLAPMMDVYNDMLSRNLLPNIRTYQWLLRALTDRDQEITWAIRSIERQRKLQDILGFTTKESAALEETLEGYRSENTYESAMSIFRALSTMSMASQISPALFQQLLRSCAYHQDSQGALLVWQHLEAKMVSNPESVPTAVMYRYMIQAYSKSDDISAVKEIFQDFRTKCARSKIVWHLKEDQELPESPRHTGKMRSMQSAHILPWNAMIELYFKHGHPELALELLDEMMASPQPEPTSELNPAHGAPIAEFRPTEPPAPAPCTFSTILSGFIDNGDLSSALSWFNRLLQQDHPAVGEFVPTTVPTRPDATSWSIVIEALAQQGMIPEMDQLLQKGLDMGVFSKDGVVLTSEVVHLVYKANLFKCMELGESLTGDEATDKPLKAVGKAMLEFAAKWRPPKTHIAISRLWEAYITIGEVDSALDLLEDVMHYDPLSPSKEFRPLRALIIQFSEAAYSNGNLTLEQQLRIAKCCHRLRIPQRHEQAYSLLEAYASAKEAGILDLSKTDVVFWEILMVRACQLAMRMPPAVDIFTLLDDFPEHLVQSLQSLPHYVATAVTHTALLTDTEERLRKAIEKFGNPSPFHYELDVYLEKISQSNSASEADESTVPTSPELSEQTEAKVYRVDKGITDRMESILSRPMNWNVNLPVFKHCMRLWEEGLGNGVMPSPYTIGRLCQTLGRVKDVEGAKNVYREAQKLLSSLADDPAVQSNAWFTLEDSMVIALAQAGDVEGAHVHRERILEHGGAPSADAYGGLILFVRDTTDDASNAMALWNESQARGVKPNIYLYNNIISKLSKARKADAALNLFFQMRENGVNPSSVTYGALIGACGRVGDVESAENLFSEMRLQKSYRPRHPPFNTMMQLYTMTKPNRRRAVHYYQEMLKDGVLPTTYTYKLLMEAYALEPMDATAMESVFEKVVTNPNIELQSTHFATLINAYGCVQRDLPKAMEIFNAIPTYPNAPPLDALIIEAMINVVVAHRRLDLVPVFLDKMNGAGVHMTAYIANVIIRGYGVAGELENAREIFESMEDPPVGVAAMHNHAPHDPSAAPAVAPAAPVYREPSTWEAMVRAELGAGNRDRAVALLERLSARQYPEAVYNRISGIMVDHSAIPPQP